MALQGKLSEKELEYRSEDDSLWLVPKPITYNSGSKQWNIWPNTILENMELSDCNDTIDGVCLQNKTLEECISECSGKCGAGVYFKFSTGKSICVPIRTGMHPTLNPVYRLRKQEYYNLLPKNVEVSVFVDDNKFSWPPNMGNSIFFYDFITLENIDTNRFLHIENTLQNNIVTFLPKKSNTTLQILPVITTAGNFQSNFPILYGDSFNLIIPGTNMIAVKKGAELEWVIAPLDLSKMYFSFWPSPQSKKKIGDPINYQEPLIIVYQGQRLYLTKNGKLTTTEFKETTFRVISRMIGYYCNKNSCDQVPIKNLDKNGMYNNSQVYRHKGCWNRCKNLYTNLHLKNTETTPKVIIPVIFLISLVIFLGICFFWFKFIKKK
jgi:hypothetical protein